jgi:hypothetical protein
MQKPNIIEGIVITKPNGIDKIFRWSYSHVETDPNPLISHIAFPCKKVIPKNNATNKTIRKYLTKLFLYFLNRFTKTKPHMKEIPPYKGISPTLDMIKEKALLVEKIAPAIWKSKKDPKTNPKIGINNNGMYKSLFFI